MFGITGVVRFANDLTRGPEDALDQASKLDRRIMLSYALLLLGQWKTELLILPSRYADPFAAS